MTLAYTPGSLIRARGREWVVLTGSDAETLRLRPISGSEDDQTLLHLALEREPVTPATFPQPDASQIAGQDAALLLRDALLLSLRRGAGPFRCFGQIAVEPRAYQLVPLLMALKLDPVRLLIADDVGVGKTIEAGLIARELLDRGDVQRMTVLCPPHLVDQWVTELEVRFHLQAVAITAANARRLTDSLPAGSSVFSVHPYTVVSLDYIKSIQRRDIFLQTCPELVIVDEAHTCASTGQGKHQRYELLRGLTESKTRHMVMLTATPHSGDEAAFFRLLGLIDRDYERLAEAVGDERTRLRERLANHFVQRRRPDIDEWKEGRQLFPKRDPKELTYKLTGAWDDFFASVLDYCAAVVASAGGDERKQRLNFWGTLALLRCAASSPLAAMSALRARAGLLTSDDERTELLDRIFDGTSDALSDDDIEPATGLEEGSLQRLIHDAEHLAGQAGDPKLKLVTDHVLQLLADGYNPVVFCRYIATAHYLGRHLAAKVKDATVSVVTGELTSDERKVRVAELGDAERRVLVASDCLSEGINLQDDFDAVVHYDLSWNPTRHEQREGRVDRFGQKTPVVRTTLIYGSNNPVDGAVLEVILKKAAKIRKELGVPVPMPDAGHTLSQALLKAVMLRRRPAEKAVQGTFDFMQLPQAKDIDAVWQDAADKAKRNRTVFAQRRLKPEDVLPEWHKTLSAIGNTQDIQRFTGRALARLGAGLEPQRHGFKVPLAALPEDVRERLESEGLEGTLHIDFEYPPAPRCRSVQRSHPLVSVLAETLLERTLSGAVNDGASTPGVLGRVGCWVSNDVASRTTVAIVRLRHQLVSQRASGSSTLLVEEAAAIAWTGFAEPPIEGEAALSLLLPAAAGEPPPHVRDRFIAQALQQLEAGKADLEAFAQRRAEVLLKDHRRVREAADARGSYSVRTVLPPDVIGVFVLLPRVD